MEWRAEYVQSLRHRTLVMRRGGEALSPNIHQWSKTIAPQNESNHSQFPLLSHKAFQKRSIDQWTTLEWESDRRQGRENKEQHQDISTKQGTLPQAMPIRFNWDVEIIVMSTEVVLVPKLTMVDIQVRH